MKCDILGWIESGVDKKVIVTDPAFDYVYACDQDGKWQDDYDLMMSNHHELSRGAAWSY